MSCGLWASPNALAARAKTKLFVRRAPIPTFLIARAFILPLSFLIPRAFILPLLLARANARALIAKTKMAKTALWRAAICLAMIALAVMLMACAKVSERAPMPPRGQADFAAYAMETRSFVAERRQIVSDRPFEEIAWNSPAEWRPASPAGKGVLLIHGLGDSPFSFVDVGPMLAEAGFLARAILLPGCGTRPEDLIGIELDDWRQAVGEQAALLAKEVGEVYLGGFSTGANLALDYALSNPSIEGLVLFSPALKSDASIAFLAPVAAMIMDWVAKPPENLRERSLVRYDMVPTDAMALWWRSTRILIPIKPFPGPALVILSEKDSVVDVLKVAGDFDKRFPHPSSRLIWYGSPEKVQGLTDRLLIKPANLPDWRIVSFSHMGALFSPDNPEYGRDGAQRLCHNGQSRELFEKCLVASQISYSAYGDAPEDIPAARLTFNPWFDWQAEILRQVWGR